MTPNGLPEPTASADEAGGSLIAEFKARQAFGGAISGPYWGVREEDLGSVEPQHRQLVEGWP
jgi:hypothetical protein